MVGRWVEWSLVNSWLGIKKRSRGIILDLMSKLVELVSYGVNAQRVVRESGRVE